jgi:hypothetical protein
MKESRSRRLAAQMLVVAMVLFALSTPAAKGQDNPFESRSSSSADPIIAYGNPPLTESMVTLYVAFDSWVMEIPASQQHRAIVRAMLMNDWRTPVGIKDNLAVLSLAAQILNQTPEEREFRRWMIQPGAIAGFRADPRPYAQSVVAAYEQTHRPIAPGNPPLTESLVSRFTTFLCWVLEIPYSSVADEITAIPLQQSLRNMLLEDWKKPTQIKKDMDFLNWQVTLANSTPEEREYSRSNTQPGIMKGARADMRNPAAQRLVAAYEEAHPVIAAGNPPLTRQAVDAFTEFLCFTKNEGGGPRLDCNQALKNSYAQQLAQTFRALPPEQQKKLAEMPQTWASLRLGWATSSEADRQKMRAQWQPAGQATPPEDPRWVAAEAAAARANAFGKKDPETVSDQELLAAAKDANTVAQEYRRQGTPQLLQYAVAWEQLAGTYRVGLGVYRQIASMNADQAAKQQANNNQMLINMQLQNQQRYNNQLRQSLNTINVHADVNGRNAAAHVNNSPDRWEVRNGH